MWHKFAVVCLHGLLFLIASAVPAAAQKTRYGVVTSIFNDPQAERTAELGTGSVRLNFYWHEIEGQQDNFRLVG